ncbi:unnamed protein product [Rhizoctonia solani]|uniref:Uncharacterized protein n=1 Tax=Rhizoctonia solani TaxID=456999 RepID=A0A8H2ZWV8_9AGAM|nr:unnamed protein product [Rhizoctonia solani]
MLFDGAKRLKKKKTELDNWLNINNARHLYLHPIVSLETHLMIWVREESVSPCRQPKLICVDAVEALVWTIILPKNASENTRLLRRSDYHQKLVTLMAFLQRNETDQANSEVRAYLASGAFKAYVTGLAEFIEDDMVRNPALYKINKLIMEDKESHGILNTQVRVKLTAMRNAIKEKV